jgi:hypothetical protein
MNYLELELLIKEKLLQEIPKSIRVLSAMDLQGVYEKDQPAPAIHIILTEDNPISEKEDGSFIEQMWTCVIVNKNNRSSEENTAELGEIIDKVLNALHNFKPKSKYKGVSYSPLNRVKTAFKPRYGNGFSYYPVQFECNFFWEKTTNGN